MPPILCRAYFSNEALFAPDLDVNTKFSGDFDCCVIARGRKFLRPKKLAFRPNDVGEIARFVALKCVHEHDWSSRLAGDTGQG
jgi:hypothetical protein